jgi:hypothetical protein
MATRYGPTSGRVITTLGVIAVRLLDSRRDGVRRLRQAAEARLPLELSLVATVPLARALRDRVGKDARCESS